MVEACESVTVIVAAIVVQADIVNSKLIKAIFINQLPFIQIGKTDKCIVMLTNATKGTKLQTSQTNTCSIRFPRDGKSETSVFKEDWMTIKVPDSGQQSSQIAFEHTIEQDQIISSQTVFN